MFSVKFFGICLFQFQHIPLFPNKFYIRTASYRTSPFLVNNSLLPSFENFSGIIKLATDFLFKRKLFSSNQNYSNVNYLFQNLSVALQVKNSISRHKDFSEPVIRCCGHVHTFLFLR